MRPIPDIPDTDGILAGSLNNGCLCVSLDKEALREALAAEVGSTDLFSLIEERCPYLFAAGPVYLSPTHIERMAQVVRAVEAVTALPAYRELVLSDAPEIARRDPGGPRGVFFGYDFHVDGSQLGLIEINTNAGGAMLNAVLARAHRACCPEMLSLMPPAASIDTLEKHIVDMFVAEWESTRPGRPLKTIAIVDDAPLEQYLYPEFLLFQKLFERHGLQAVIADPAELRLEDGALRHGELAIDLVYNRLTDFMLASPSNAALREAYLERIAVITPHPQAHALYANKRNLALLCDAGRLRELGAAPEAIELLREGIPHTEVVRPEHAERLWNERKRLFFKPAGGYGSRAAYRGDKITKRVWEEILAGDYVAQAIAAPGERTLPHDDKPLSLKFDVRDYVYGGVLWTAARLYQGQTTNFRTPGGGFAPVYSPPYA